MQKTHILDYTLEEWQNYSLAQGQKRFRGEQIFRCLHERLEFDLSKANIPKPFLELIQQSFTFPPAEPHRSSSSESDGTAKDLWLFEKDRAVESVWLPYEDRQSICISTQFGCSLDCSFCATGKLKFKGNLSTGEILAQVYLSQKRYGKRISNVVLMGMGEPFYNYDNSLKACRILNHDMGLNIGAGRITISTSGVLPAIEKYVNNAEPFSLALSVHAANAYKRAEIMDIEKKFALKDIADFLQKNRHKMGKNRLTIEYILIKDFNMSEADAEELANLAHKIRAKVNLIPLNTSFLEFERPSDAAMNQFWQRLHNRRVLVFNRQSPGRSIDAACGMLAGTA